MEPSWIPRLWMGAIVSQLLVQTRSRHMQHVLTTLKHSSNYFNRTDVKKAINANPDTNYAVCGDSTLGIYGDDQSPPSALGPLPKVIEMTNNVVIGGGMLDYLLLTNGTLATIQSMYCS